MLFIVLTMGVDKEAQERAVSREVFRPWALLRLTVVVAALFWVLVFFFLVGLEGVTGRTYASVAFFIVFFSALGVFYSNTRIELSGDALIVRGVTSSRTVPLSDVIGVDTTSGFMQTTYRVLAHPAPVLFSSAFGGHRRLGRLIEERARIARL